jgi:hypothetical protein
MLAKTVDIQAAILPVVASSAVSPISPILVIVAGWRKNDHPASSVFQRLRPSR